MLTCPDNKSARNHQPKSCVPAKITQITMMRGQTASIVSTENFVPFQFVPVRVKTQEYHH